MVVKIDAHSTISIHAPRTGSDDDFSQLADFDTLFQSTLPARGATVEDLQEQVKRLISIHAPRTGSDERIKLTAEMETDFNPRSPHGERRGADADFLAKVVISIHAPRTGSDPAQTRIRSAI